VIAEAKSSVNGATAAKLPTGTPQQRLQNWVNDFRAGKYSNADAATQARIMELVSVYEKNDLPKGIWVQAEVPKFNSSNVAPLDILIHAW
jgi:hypothetical protein